MIPLWLVRKRETPGFTKTKIMVRLDDGIYCSGDPLILNYARYVERGCKRWHELPVGYGRRARQNRQVHIFGGGVHQGLFWKTC